MAPDDEVAVIVCGSVYVTIRFADGSERKLDVAMPDAVSEFTSTSDTYGPLMENTAA